MSIVVNGQKNIFLLQTKSNSYAFGIDDQGLVRHLYWGSKINAVEDFEMPKINEVSTNDPVFELTKEEFPVFGGLRYKEYCLKVNFANGTREIVYKYCGYDIKKSNDYDELVVSLKDAYFDFLIDLHYKVYEDYDLMERYVVVKNKSNQPVEIERLHSGQFHIPYEGLNFTNVRGHWAAEQDQFVQKVGYGKILFENRHGMSSLSHNPYFVLDRDATEDTGDVYFGALRFTGNFSGIIDQTQYGGTQAQIGINDYDFALELKPGEEFTAPAVICGYSANGFTPMSQNLHRFARNFIMRQDYLPPVLYNSWEATEFDVHCNEQVDLAKKAKELGAEMFVIDDGWFGERNNTKNGLGDWYVNPVKFPNGLNELISAVKKLDMKFGIWVEPEGVNPPTQLYKEHPDWIYQFEGRPSDTSRDQYALNLSKPEVRAFIFNTLDDLLTKYDIDYIKWDINRPIAQPTTKDVWYKHIEALYGIVKDLKKKHPKVLFEACASGGGRIDYGILGIYDDFWASDNTDAYDRLAIQTAYSYIYPMKAMRAWVTDIPNYVSDRPIPMKYRFHSAMMGSLGIGCNILKFSDADMETAKKMIAEYKGIRHIVQEGDFYRLENLSTNDFSLFEYLKGDEGLVFAFLSQTKIGHRGVRIKLKGLCEDADYVVTLNPADFKNPPAETEITKNGAYLMKHGINIRLVGDYASTIIKIRKK